MIVVLANHAEIILARILARIILAVQMQYVAFQIIVLHVPVCQIWFLVQHRQLDA